MVPDKFNMVDMEGIDIIESQGLAVPGLYQKLVDSTAQCRYQCLYNWKFDGIIIPPSYVEMEVREDGVWINEGVSVDEDDVVHIYSIEPEPPSPILPEIEPLTVTENGEYHAPVGVDGYNPVNVSVPGIEFRTTQPLDSEGIDGDICAIYSPFISFRFFKLTISAVRSSGMQMSEINFLKDGLEVAIPAGTTITSTGAPYSQNESVDKLIDGSVDTKYYTTSVPVTITIEFPSEVDYTEWKWYTANDSPGRDPSAFSVEVSADGNNWIPGDSVTGFSATQTRKALAYEGTIRKTGVYEVLIKVNGAWANIMGYLPE